MISDMTSRERLLSALRGEEVDRLPFSPNLAYLFETLPQELRDLGHAGFFDMIGADHLNRFCPCPVKVERPETMRTQHWQEGVRKGLQIETPVGAVTMEWRHSGDVADTWFHVVHPLRAEEDFKVWRWIEEHSRMLPDFAAAHERLRLYGEKELALGMLLPRTKTAFQTLVESLVGTEELVYALCDFPDTVEELWQVMVAKNLEAVRIAAQSSYDFFITWEDSSTQNYSPVQYETYIAAEIRQWTGILAEYGKQYIQHACGHIKALLPIMREQGIVGVESLSPAPTGDLTLGEARSLLGGNQAIIGGIEPTRFLELDLKALGPYIEETIEQGLGGPFILANSDSCPPGVTVEKFKLVAEIAKSVKQPRLKS